MANLVKDFDEYHSQMNEVILKKQPGNKKALEFRYLPTLRTKRILISKSY